MHALRNTRLPEDGAAPAANPAHGGIGRWEVSSFARFGGGDRFDTLERQLAYFGTALWGLAPLLRVAAADPDGGQRRTSFSGPTILAPATFRGYSGAQGRHLYLAALAHVQAHLHHGGRRFPAGSLKPMQIALISLIEDARVEHLAMRGLPGLGHYWQPYHVAEPTASPTAASLMARLARALIAPDHADPDGWIAKARRLFFEAEPEWHDPAISRRIGGLLGNDLGQMRLQFDGLRHVVEPVYRDDNKGLWHFERTGDEAADDDALPLPARLEPDDGKPPQSGSPPDDADKVRLTPIDPEAGIPIARYPEWDHLIGAARLDWTTLVEYQPALGDAGPLALLLHRHHALLERMVGVIQPARISRSTRLRRQPDGEEFDLDAALTATIDQRTGLTPDPRIYTRFERRMRDLSVLLLLDGSRSTNDRSPVSGQRVLDLEIEAAALLARALERSGDLFAIRAFCSNKRDDVRYYRIKDFAEPHGALAEQRLAGLAGEYSTRIGAALRHAGAELALRQSYRKLLLVITDGEPSDIDIADRKYLVEDARHAAHALARDGIDVFCIGLDGEGENYLHRMFGARRVLHVDRIEKLPECAAALYVRLTT
ncbi:VWA domain-containing protein [Acidiphilium sp. AL]|uniref:nitric oxide reductase activation protein NorD n=1 Tax=Acidiphilium sp. AL TaxID=2871704 RepID=UPI0021CB1B71|nr:VWA domain-containing protein [Acidiphilium sp. AL]MCU4161091.1 VWA domain-containing protein [Acidiphilium sp. AL]